MRETNPCRRVYQFWRTLQKDKYFIPSSHRSFPSPYITCPICVCVCACAYAVTQSMHPHDRYAMHGTPRGVLLQAGVVKPNPQRKKVIAKQPSQPSKISSWTDGSEGGERTFSTSYDTMLWWRGCRKNIYSCTGKHINTRQHKPHDVCVCMCARAANECVFESTMCVSTPVCLWMKQRQLTVSIWEGSVLRSHDLALIIAASAHWQETAKTGSSDRDGGL